VVRTDRSARQARSSPHQEIYFGEAIDESHGSGIGVTFIRWGAGETGAFDYPLPYDEVLIVTRGSYTVSASGTTVTARAGEVIHLPAGHTGNYHADEDAEVVAVTHPPYQQAIRDAGHADQLDQLHEASP
jgi:ethanolamine utilization protein EutQ